MGYGTAYGTSMAYGYLWFMECFFLKYLRGITTNFKTQPYLCMYIFNILHIYIYIYIFNIIHIYVNTYIKRWITGSIMMSLIYIYRTLQLQIYMPSLVGWPSGLILRVILRTQLLVDCLFRDYHNQLGWYKFSTNQHSEMTVLHAPMCLSGNLVAQNLSWNRIFIEHDAVMAIYQL